MKKHIFILLLVITIFSFPITSSANTSKKAILTRYSPDITVYYDGYSEEFRTMDGMEVFPLTYNGTTYLPLKCVGNLFHKGISWTNSTRSITLNDSDGVLTNFVCNYKTNNPLGFTPQYVNAYLCSNIKIYVNGKLTTLKDNNGNSLYPIIYNDSTYLPVRALSEIFNKEINWENQNKSIVIGRAIRDGELIEKSRYNGTELGEKCLSIITATDDIYNELISYAQIFTTPASDSTVKTKCWDTLSLYSKTYMGYDELLREIKAFNQSKYTASEKEVYKLMYEHLNNTILKSNDLRDNIGFSSTPEPEREKRRLMLIKYLNTNSSPIKDNAYTTAYKLSKTK